MIVYQVSLPSMLLLLFVFVILLFSDHHILALQKKTSDSLLRLLMIGDSVDRYSIHDWCHRNNGTLTMSVTEETNAANITYMQRKTLAARISKDGIRRKSWELRFCDALATRQVVVTMISNKFGVKSEPPWHSPYQTTFGLGHVNFTGRTIRDVFELGIIPGLDILDLVMGGPPHGVMFNSVFWDLSHPDPEDKRKLMENMWLDSWGHNVSVLMDVITARYGKNDTYYLWRQGTHMRTVSLSSHWNTNHAYQMMLRMNNLARNISSNHGFDVLEAYNSKMALRDPLHPAPQVAVSFVDALVARSQEFLQRKASTSKSAFVHR